jgi:hypothetical protein
MQMKGKSALRIAMTLSPGRHRKRGKNDDVRLQE